jgi:hypothetical protein
MQTAHVCVFGGAPNSFRHEQNIFVFVSSSTWHSSPITASHPVIVRAAYPVPHGGSVPGR